MNYTPAYKIASKILKLSKQISEELTKLQFTGIQKVNSMFRKKNRIKTLAGTLEIEGNFINEEKITNYELIEKLSMSESGIKKVIKELKDEIVISRIGILKSGYWK